MPDKFAEDIVLPHPTITLPRVSSRTDVPDPPSPAVQIEMAARGAKLSFSLVSSPSYFNHPFGVDPKHLRMAAIQLRFPWSQAFQSTTTWAQVIFFDMDESQHKDDVETPTARGCSPQGKRFFEQNSDMEKNQVRRPRSEVINRTKFSARRIPGDKEETKRAKDLFRMADSRWRFLQREFARFLELEPPWVQAQYSIAGTCPRGSSIITSLTAVLLVPTPYPTHLTFDTSEIKVAPEHVWSNPRDSIELGPATITIENDPIWT
ncbi:hypothetical protein BDZ89DRAFT_1136393 [Hymenopellis radicata]|nr:hypothetical protein BDZ89DRAFT_1136393 [Hymenopellis radicata]